MNTRELDRLLCEHLGIDCEFDGWKVLDSNGVEYLTWGDVENGEARCQQFIDMALPSRNVGWHVARIREYPALSTTGDGMWTLMQALKKKKFDVQTNIHSEDEWGVCIIDSHQIRCYGQVDASLPLALACAAADALGIKPPKEKD